MKITIGDRLVNLVFGFFGGLITFFVWGAAILIKGGPSSAKAAAGGFYFGIKLSLFMAVVFALIGFLMGQDRLVKALSTVWGTNAEFNERVENMVFSIPLWVGYLVLGIAIAGAYGYLIGVVL